MYKNILIRCFGITVFLLLFSMGFSGPTPKAVIASPDLLVASAGQDESEVSQRTIVISTSFPENVPTYRIYEAVYREAFRRMGYGFQMVYHPGLRSMIEVNSGKLDGTTGRVIDINKNKAFPNLIRVRESILSMQLIALAMNPSIKIDSWQSLRGFKITYHRGAQYIEKNIFQFVDRADIISASDYKQAFRLLSSGRVDLYIEVEDAEVFVRIVPEYKNLTFHRAGDVGTLTLYPYMHRKNKGLADKLAEVLQAMKADRTYYRILKTARANE